LERRSSEQTGRPITRRIEGRPSTNGCQEQLVNYLMLHEAETLWVVNDKEKREDHFCKYVYRS
jgi:hypothetical protein